MRIRISGKHLFQSFRYVGFLSTLALSLGNHVCVAAEPTENQANTWPQFLNGGKCVTDTQLPTTWAPDSSNIAWQAELTGYGQSSPVSDGTHVFVTSTSGPNKETFHVASFSLASGEQIWQADFVNPSPEENTSYVSRAAPTPALDNTGVYVSNEGGLLASLDFSGKVTWQRDLVAEFGPIKARHGLAASLQQHENLLFIWIERSEQSYLMAVDKASGETVWKVDGLGATSWSSPMLLDVENNQHLICSASGKIVGVDPQTGKRLWELTDISNNTSCTPIPIGNGRFFIGASDGRGEENDGKGAASNGLVEVSKKDESFIASFVWRAEKASCTFGSPIVAANSVWIVNRTGALYQLDLDTGKQLSVGRVKSGGIWATPLVAADKLYLFGQKGTTSVVSIPDAKEIASNNLWNASSDQAGEPNTNSHVQYAAAVAGETLLIRRGDRLYALRNQ